MVRANLKRATILNSFCGCYGTCKQPCLNHFVPFHVITTCYHSACCQDTHDAHDSHGTFGPQYPVQDLIDHPSLLTLQQWVEVNSNDPVSTSPHPPLPSSRQQPGSSSTSFPITGSARLDSCARARIRVAQKPLFTIIDWKHGKILTCRIQHACAWYTAMTRKNEMTFP